MARLRIMYIEDDPVDAKTLQCLIDSSQLKAELDIFQNLGAALATTRTYSSILLDLSLPDGSGSDTLQKIRKSFPNSSIIVVTGNMDPEQAEGFAELGADDYLYKDELTPSGLRKSIFYANSRRKLQIYLEKKANDLKLVTELEKRASNLKNQFFASVSHDLRTPLGAVLGYSEILERMEGLPDEAVEYVKRIRKNSCAVVSIVDDLLDLASIESGNVKVKEEPFDVLAEFDSLFADYELKAREKKISFGFKYLTPIAKDIITDRIRLRQVIDNLVTNAFKYTDKGRIELEIASEMKGSQQRLIIKVIDTGYGISKDDQKKIFEPFKQVGNRISSSPSGVGLGLALSNQLAKLLDGEIKLEHSELNRGSTFSFTFTVKVSYQENQSLNVVNLDKHEVKATKESESKFAQKHLKVLLAEDSPDNQIVIGCFLAELNCDVITVDNGGAAVESAMHGSYDIILMDMQMPVLTGDQATKQLRMQGYVKPIIALTAYASDAESKHILSCGCDGFISKPVSLESLRDGIQTTLNQLKTTSSLNRPHALTTDISLNSNPEILDSQFEIQVLNFVKKIEKAVLSKNWKKLGAHSKSLRSSVKNHGYDEVVKTCSDIEANLKNVENVSILASKVHQLKKQCRNAMYRGLE